jgi:hypothetical protein
MNIARLSYRKRSRKLKVPSEGGRIAPDPDLSKQPVLAASGSLVAERSIRSLDPYTSFQHAFTLGAPTRVCCTRGSRCTTGLTGHDMIFEVGTRRLDLIARRIQHRSRSATYKGCSCDK